jgi:predicted RNase H-like HicB family nuclease
MKLTITISKGEHYFIGSIKEIPAVLTQGETIEETRENVLDALRIYLEDMQQEKRFENTILEEDLTIA